MDSENLTDFEQQKADAHESWIAQQERSFLDSFSE